MINPVSSALRTTGTNLLQAKTHNHRVVLEVVRTQGPLSRADIARVTKLSRQTIQNIIAELEKIGLVSLKAAMEKPKRRGHPGIMVHFRPEGGSSLGIHLDQFSLVAILTDLAGTPLFRKSIPLAYPDPETAVLTIGELLETIRREKPQNHANLVGIGLALPGPFNVRGLTSVGPTTLPDWLDPEMGDWLCQRLGLPVIVENDASAAAVGEYLYGAGQPFSNFCYIYFGFGLGAGVIIDGSLYPGLYRNAGEIGHMMVEPGGVPCPCGNAGCLERYVSVQSLCEFLGIEGPTRKTLDDLGCLFAENDPRLAPWLDRAVLRLRQTINILESILDTEMIIMGGTLPESMLSRLMREVAPLHGSVGGARTTEQRILAGSTGPEVTALGAAALSIAEWIGPKVDKLLKS